MTEEWKDILELNGEYQVSNLGRIRRAKECVGRNSHNSFVGRIIKPVVDQKGYLRFRLHRRKLFFQVHRLVADAFIPNTDSKPFINHLNGIKSDNRVENLEWCTTLENNSYNRVLIIRKFISLLDPMLTYSPNQLEEKLSSINYKQGYHHW